MKKYWKLIMLTTIIVLTLGMYFFHVQYISNSFAYYEIETLEGDESFVERVTITGSMYTSFHSSEPFKLTSKGTDFLIDKPLAEAISFHDSGKIAAYQRSYRSFMRNKEKTDEQYDENDDFVAYATIPHTRWGIQQDELELALLDKATNKSRKFFSPFEEEYSYISVQGVKIYDDSVSVITLNEKYSGDGGADYLAYHVYTFDLASEELVHQAVIPLEKENSGAMTYGVLMDEKSIPDEIIISEMKVDVIEKSSGVILDTAYRDTALEVEESFRTTRLQKYNLRTQQIEEIPLPEEAGIPIRYNGQDVIFAKIEDKKLSFTRYNIDNNQLEDTLDIALKEHNLSVWEIESAIVEDDLYFLHTLTNSGFMNKSLPMIIVIDLNTLEVKYRGQVVNKMPDNLGSFNEVDFDKLELN